MPLKFPEYAEEAYSYPLLVGQILKSSLANTPHSEIVYGDDVRMSYGDFAHRVDLLSSALADLGVEEGTTVAVMDWDSHRYLECYFAIPMMGAVLQTVNVRFSNDQIRYCLEHAAAEILIVHSDFLDVINDVLPSLPNIKHLIFIADGTASKTPDSFTIEYEAMLSRSFGGYPWRDFDENAIATTFYTTGTIGDPKAVTSTHRQLVIGVLAVLGALGKQLPEGLSTRDVYMPMTPMFHVHAWSMPYVATMIGLKQVYPGRYDYEALLRLRSREGVTYSHCVPTILQLLLQAAQKRGDDLSGWKIAIGGAVMTHALCAAAQSAGLIVMAGYGMSETGPGLLLSRSRHGGSDVASMGSIETLCTAGLPIPLVQLKVVNDAMEDVARDGQSIGEVVARAPWLTTAYRENAPESADLWRHGWLHTQDLATVDDTGYVQIIDRAKDVIKSGGEWISSLALERLLSTHAAIEEVAIIGIPDARWGERPVAVIVAVPETSLTIDDVRAHLEPAVAAGIIARYAQPDKILLVDKLPRTSVGKTDKKAIRNVIARQGGI